MSEPTGGFAPTYGVALLTEAKPRLSATELLRAIRTYCPATEPLDESGKVLCFLHPDHPLPLEETAPPAPAAICPQTFVAAGKEPFTLSDAMSNVFEQSWSFPEAREVVARCRHDVLVTDLISSLLEYKERLALFQDALAGLLDVIPALAIHWISTEQFIRPQQFLDGYREGGARRFFAGPLNVRFYNITNSPGDMIMDTLGLAALGLPDLQCHFRGLEPGRVAAVLSNTGYYLFEAGDIIADGHTVEGTTPGSGWRCQHEESQLQPTRTVLDLDPGYPHAAGTRQASGSPRAEP